MRRALILCVVVASAATARAQDAAALERDPAAEEARALFERGRELADTRRFHDAAEAFSASLALFDRPSTAFNLALTLFALGRHVEAIAVLERYLAATSPDDPAEAGGRADAERMLAHARRSISQLELTVLPADAEVRVDGALVTGGGTRTIVLDAGTHVVRADAPGHAPSLVEVRTRAGEARRHAIQLASTETPARVVVSVGDAPEAVITIDGEEVGRGRAALELEAGPHEVQVTHPSLAPFTRAIELDFGEHLELAVAPAPRVDHGLGAEAALWGALIGVVVAAAGAGIAIGVVLAEEPPVHGGSSGVVLGSPGAAMSRIGW